jgi:hypothetical protein
MGIYAQHSISKLSISAGIALVILKQYMGRPVEMNEGALIVAFAKAIGAESGWDLGATCAQMERVYNPHVYTLRPRTTVEDNPGMIVYMDPILDEALVPNRCYDNEQVMIDERVVKVRPKVTLTQQMLQHCNEFASLFAGDIGMQWLFEEDDLFQLQDTEVRRRQQIEGGALSPYAALERCVRTFMKNETYHDFKPGRNITTFSSSVRFYASLIYKSLGKAMKSTSFYAFGYTPRQVSDMVPRVLSGAETAVASDFSKFDGTVNQVSRTLETIILRAVFPQELHDFVLTVHELTFNNHGKTRKGVTYDQEFSRGSGEPGTSSMNTIHNAFIAYATLRHMGCKPADAYAKLGIYGGDDGLTADLDPELYADTAMHFGFRLKIKVLHFGDCVDFLARYWGPGAWQGDPNSMADVRRAIGKFHLSARRQEQPAQIAYDKAYSYWLNDRNTPLLGPFTLHIMRHTGIRTPKELTYHGKRSSESEPFFNEEATWMHEFIATQLPGWDVEAFTRWTLTSDWRHPPCILPVIYEAHDEMLIDGEYVSDYVPHRQGPSGPQ